MSGTRVGENMCEKVVNNEASYIEHDIVVLGVLEYQWYKRFFPVRRYGPVGESYAPWELYTSRLMVALFR